MKEEETKGRIYMRIDKDAHRSKYNMTRKYNIQKFLQKQRWDFFLKK